MLSRTLLGKRRPFLRYNPIKMVQGTQQCVSVENGVMRVKLEYFAMWSFTCLRSTLASVELLEINLNYSFSSVKQCCVCLGGGILKENIPALGYLVGP